MDVFILLFNAGTDNEGIHSIKLLKTGEEVVLGFEAEDDATRFAVLLEAQDFLEPTVEAIDRQEVEDLCREYGYVFQVIPAGQLQFPPQTNVEKTDWQAAQQPEGGDLTVPMVDNLEEFRRRLERLME